MLRWFAEAAGPISEPVAWLAAAAHRCGFRLSLFFFFQATGEPGPEQHVAHEVFTALIGLVELWKSTKRHERGLAHGTGPPGQDHDADIAAGVARAQGAPCQ